MSGKNVLITGGGGFLGSYLVPELCARGHRVTVVDNLHPQTHAGATAFTDSLKSLAVCVNGDVRDADLWQRLASTFPNVEIIVHMAAWMGTGQSTADVRECESVNAGGTATMLGAILDRLRPESYFTNLRHIVLASSSAVYGEGAYHCPACASGLVFPMPRSAGQLSHKQWGFACPKCNGRLSPAPTPEAAPKLPPTLYSATKLAQEHYLRSMLHTAGLGNSILRLYNVFGPGQHFASPYTGFLDRFCSAILSGRQVELPEDGQLTRDMVYISDAVDALACAVDKETNGVFNIGSGTFTRMADMAHWLCGSLNRDVPVVAPGAYRVGDIRHGAADTKAAREALTFVPRVSAAQGLQRYSEWVRSNRARAGQSANLQEHTSEMRQAA